MTIQLNMHINVKLYGKLKTHAPGERNAFEMALDPGDTLRDVLKQLSIHKDHCVSLIDGRRADPSMRFKDGDTLVLFPPIAGG